MSWGIDFKADVYLDRQDYGENPIQVQDRIDELSKDLADVKSQIKMFASSNPDDIVPKEWEEEKIRWISDQINELFELYDEFHTLRDNLFLYLDYLKSEHHTS